MAKNVLPYLEKVLSDRGEAMSAESRLTRRAGAGNFSLDPLAERQRLKSDGRKRGGVVSFPSRNSPRPLWLFKERGDMERLKRLHRDSARTFHHVILAGLGALVKARQEGKGGDDLLRELMEKGKALRAEEPSDLDQSEISPGEPSLADEGREILVYADVLDRLLQERRTFERMVDAMLPEGPLPTPPAVLQARRNAEAREKLIRDFGVLSSADIASLAGSRAKNKASLAHRWKQEGRIFSVPYRGSVYFPAYQFDEKGQPLSVIGQVLATLGHQSREWELALWFTSANGWVDGRRPVDLLRSEPEEVAQAAEREAEGLFF